ncbi:MAG: hypothetical protein AB7G75_13600 [Candidatus Binatia bacterium]
MKKSVGAIRWSPLRALGIGMGQYYRAFFLCCSIVFLLSQAGCFFSGGVSTVQSTTGADGTGFFSATERDGQWDWSGPPPKVGEVTERPMYRLMRKEAAYSLFAAGKDYGLSEPYPDRKRRITAIREVGAVTDNGNTRHYYEVEFNIVE